MNILIAYHYYLVLALIGAIVLNMTIVYFLKNNFFKAVKWSRIGYFIFWGIWAMVVFSGLIVFVFMKQKLNIPITSMIILSLILPTLDGYRAIKVGKLWREENLGTSLAIKILLIEIVLTIGVTALALIK